MTRCFEWHTDCISAIGVFLFGCSNGRHDQVIRNAADKHQLTHPAMGLIPLLPQMIIKEGTYQLRSLAMDKSMTPSPLPSVINGSTTLCNCHSKRKPNECLSIEALIVFLYMSDIPWYWTIMIPTHSNTITLMSGFATTQCWKCHKYPTGFLLILDKRVLSRKQHCPLMFQMLPDVAGWDQAKKPVWGHETRVGNKYRCTSVWEICQPADNMVRKIINQGGSIMLLLFTTRYIFVEFQHSWSKDRALARKEFVLAGTVSLLIPHIYQASCNCNSNAHNTAHRALV